MVLHEGSQIQTSTYVWLHWMVRNQAKLINNDQRQNCVTNHPGLPEAFPVLTLAVPHPRKPLSSRQSMTTGHPGDHPKRGTKGWALALYSMYTQSVLFFLRIWTRKGEVLKKWDGQQCSFVSFANVFTTQNKALKIFIPFQVPLLVGHFSSWWRASKKLSISFRQMGSDSQLAC